PHDGLVICGIDLDACPKGAGAATDVSGRDEAIFGATGLVGFFWLMFYWPIGMPNLVMSKTRGEA
ncbi:MAG TPA: hypothetical protein VIP07_03610, partial [Candidatus Limnocylindria bacterium]